MDDLLPMLGIATIILALGVADWLGKKGGK